MMISNADIFFLLLLYRAYEFFEAASAPIRRKAARRTFISQCPKTAPAVKAEFIRFVMLYFFDFFERVFADFFRKDDQRDVRVAVAVVGRYSGKAPLPRGVCDLRDVVLCLRRNIVI